MDFTIPVPLQIEHDELHGALKKAIQAGGQVGSAAEAVAKVLHDHFLKEEEFALPPLALLSPLAEGRVHDEMKPVLKMTDRLKAELPKMLEEHQAVIAALKRLIAAAEAENRPEHARFAEKLMLHARTEEEVLYPAAILVGEYVKGRIPAGG